MKDKGVKIVVKLPPKRSEREWREITNMKLRQYEAIGFAIMGKKSVLGGSRNE